MTTYRNDAKGNRGISLKSGGYAWLAPGEIKTIRSDWIRNVPNGLTVVDPEPAEQPEQSDELPALGSMTKAELIAQATVEGVDVEAIEGTGSGGKVTNDDIKAAIEAKRTRAAAADS